MWAVIGYGGCVFFKKLETIRLHVFLFIVSTFISSGYLYNYGYKIDSFCFDKDIQITNLWHSLLHIISSIGHHCIVLC